MRTVACCLLIVLCLGACAPAERAVFVHDAERVPERLSEWGIVYVRGDAFRLGNGVLPYALNTPLFSDYALKLRTLWMPADRSASMLPDGEVKFPVGTILSKTFHYEKAESPGPDGWRLVREERRATLDASGSIPLDRYLLVETRLLVRYADGWYAFPYVWNSAQDEAYLDLAGAIRQLEFADGESGATFAYVVPDANQCGACHMPDHSQKALEPLGPQAWQLNRVLAYVDGPENQLQTWVSAGFLDAVPAHLPAGVDWYAPAGATTESRAKAYLDANCAHCHNAKGAADTSALVLNAEAPVDRHYGVCKPPVAVGRGSGDRPYDIYPGRPEESILVYRMEHSDPAIAMPELGRAVVHAEGLALMRTWIAAMNGEC